MEYRLSRMFRISLYPKIGLNLNTGEYCLDIVKAEIEAF